MPLIDLKTNLKSLKYGNDRPGGASSGQPYIQSPIPEAASQDFLQFYQNNRTSLDFPIRGGGYNLGSVGPFVPQAARIDRERIDKFLKDAPRGPIFILKQQALQLSNPKIQVGNQVNLDLGTQPFRFLGELENTRIYNAGKNTLSQVNVQGSGLHFDRHGTLPINPYQQTYAYVVDERIQNNTKSNRLNLLYQTKILTSGNIPLNSVDAETIETLNNLGISRNPDLLFQYIGGPSSVGGLGLTTIHRRVSSLADGFTVVERGKLDETAGSYLQVILSGSRTLKAYNRGIVGDLTTPPFYWRLNAGSYNIGNTTDDYKRFYNTVDSTNINVQGTEVGTTNPRNFSYTYDYNLLKSDGNTRTIGQTRVTADFRKAIVEARNTKDLASTDGYSQANNITLKYGIGSPGYKDLKRVNYSESVNKAGTPVNITQDAINMLDVGETGTALDSQNHLRDLITFRFDTIEINQPTVPIVFRAFLTGMTDNHNAEYSAFRYVGRGENFYTYNGFTREIGFNFKVAAQSRSEMKFLYRKVNYLLSQLYPDYKAGTGFMRAPLIKLTIGDYLYQQPGFLKSVNITVPDDSPWEIANNQIEGADDDMYQLPHVLELACQFTPIHDFLPRRARLKDLSTPDAALIPPFITPNKPTTNLFGVGKLK